MLLYSHLCGNSDDVYNQVLMRGNYQIMCIDSMAFSFNQVQRNKPWKLYVCSFLASGIIRILRWLCEISKSLPYEVTFVEA